MAVRRLGAVCSSRIKFLRDRPATAAGARPCGPLLSASCGQSAAQAQLRSQAEGRFQFIQNQSTDKLEASTKQTARHGSEVTQQQEKGGRSPAGHRAGNSHLHLQDKVTTWQVTVLCD